MRINDKAVKGEPGTGFEKAGDKGDFACENCEYYKADGESSTGFSCGQEDMAAKSKEPRTKPGRVEVSPRDCCEYVDRTGKAEPRSMDRLVQVIRSMS